MEAEKPTENEPEEKVEEYKMIGTAKVLWPADMPDDMLEVIMPFVRISPISLY